MSQTDYTGLIILAGVGGLAWYGYEQGWFAGLFPATTATGSTTTFPTGFTPITASAMALSEQIAMIQALQANATPAATIQATLAAIAAAYAACQSPNTWTPMTLSSNLMVGNGFNGGCSNSVANSTSNQPIQTSIPVTTVPINGTTNPGITTSTMVQELSAANTSGSLTLNADQWNYYWNQLSLPTVPDSVFIAAFFPNGRPADPSQNPMMTAGQFYALLQANGMTGLSGLGNYEGIPMGAIHGGW